ncbi:MAG: metallophosphoesterase [Roseburia sp.]|nr:metallophosphoesterase [Roseburia sp.]
MSKRRKKNKKVFQKKGNKGVRGLVRKLKKSQIRCSDIPEEYQNDKDIINAECKSGIRKLDNINNVSKLDFKNTQDVGAMCEKLGISRESYKIDDNKIESFAVTKENEENTQSELKVPRGLPVSNEVGRVSLYNVDMTKESICYVSDIHLLHKLRDSKLESMSDVVYIIKAIVDNIVEESRNIILIGGDVSSDFSIFELFIKIFRCELDSKGHNPLVIFVLGNHELWEFSQTSFDEIVEKYNNLINKYGMYLLQNNILYKDSEKNVHTITAKEILFLGDKELREKTRTAQIVFFGGLAFSGYNEQFNANNGIYRGTIDRDMEIKESKGFEELYKKVCSAFFDKKLVIFTHMPMDCWNKKIDYHKNYIYVSGHTHKNYFFDDGDIRIYADNQIGYENSKVHMKYFDIDTEYDYFADYKDGIYEITGQDYRDFYQGKNIMINFNRKVNILYMLKKNGYYCFIHKSKHGSLSILNGGALKKLDRNNVNYYYDNMDSIIEHIRKPLDIYTNIQQAISKEIKNIGGSGFIHGCIIDIDFFNHVYVNPYDKKITAYCALDIINKEVYPSVSALLKRECPELYVGYIKLLTENPEGLSVLKNDGNDANGENGELALLPKDYLDTDIYIVSRKIKKMQKLNSNILAVWYERKEGNNMIEQDTDK